MLKTTKNKKRNWAFVAYPESLPNAWIEQLQQSGLQCAISPLHDRDYNADGSLKKAHYHVILCYSGPTSFNVVRNLVCDQLGQPIPQALEQIRGYYRYFTHKDNPEKAQYNESEIKFINGFNINDYVELTKSEIVKIKSNIQTIIKDNQIYEYSDLLDFLQSKENYLNEYEIALNNTLLFDRYISSRRHKKNEV